jgi:hypothetical protein
MVRSRQRNLAGDPLSARLVGSATDGILRGVRWRRWLWLGDGRDGEGVTFGLKIVIH